ncbi:MAG TPA: DUF5615 family PIN-like protein [Pyrinomonadaceae bacterium]|nr:DUF5615 family PIN-like protein [Acidobacteriota bacterium]HQZ96217.1 DUF5615 family PIN-like protein [Pyrinomonadaceae bacterium]HRA41628.1 DUF5615 family PIN-like protein [Pyrinomonadaceae bacterium]
MRFKIDENLPVEVASILRSAGHEAMTVFEQNMVGEEDNRLLSVCSAESRALITLDLDFSDIRAYPPDRHFGLIVIRSRQQDKATVIDYVTRLIPLLDEEPLQGRLWIVEENRIRVREGI